jgi:hypothetical protein
MCCRAGPIIMQSSFASKFIVISNILNQSQTTNKFHEIHKDLLNSGLT